MDLERQAAAAMEANQVERTPCANKQACLDKIADDEADAMAVGDPFVMGEVAIMAHTAIRFHDRDLGAKVRAYTMRGFHIQARK